MKKDIFGIPGLFGSKTFVDGKGSVVGGSTKDIWGNDVYVDAKGNYAGGS